MSAPWTDERIESALGSLADVLEVPGPSPIERGAPSLRRLRRRRVLAAAAAVLAVIALSVAVPSTRRAMAEWFGLRKMEVRFVGDRAADPDGLPRFADGVAAISVDDALATVGLDGTRLVDVGLGPPEFAGQPPEGGVLVAWDRDTTLWIRPLRPPPDASELVTKQLSVDDAALPIAEIGDGAVYVDGEHVLATPSRRVAADRILWWIDDGTEYRLESDRPLDELVEIAQGLSP